MERKTVKTKGKIKVKRKQRRNERQHKDNMKVE